MGGFFERLASATPRSDRGRRWIWVPYDQLTADAGPLAEGEPGELGIVLVESPWKAGRRPYHRQKLALVLANQRQFALEQAERGVAVRYRIADGPYREALAEAAAELGPLIAMEPAERELRADVAPLVEEGRLELVPHAGWLTSREQFGASQSGPPWRMDAFYRHVRRETGLLMEDGKPAGGKYSFDAENRRPWSGEPPAPDPPRFRPDAVTREVGDLIESRFGHHPGSLDLSRLPASAADAERLWGWALAECLEHFGPYEDAMSRRSRGLFHTRISPLLNLCRLLPERVVREAVACEAPLASREGFVRQVAGWREFVRHVHRETDGFRRLPGHRPPVSEEPGDAGYTAWRGADWPRGEPDAALDGGARVSYLRARWPLPAAFWGSASGLACLDRVVEEVWEDGYSHHITRLMVLANLATLLDVEPRQLADWFWVAYLDAFDWVVEPNVLAMGTFATGELMTTKPYVSGAAYIDRMGDYCGACRFDPKHDCPITRLYWSFLERKRGLLQGNRRMALPLASLEKRAPGEKEHDARTFRAVRERLEAGLELTPGELPER